MKKVLILLIISGLFTLTACNSSNETVHQYTVPLEISLEEKVVYVDDFLNLTENDSLNIFEEGVPDLLERSLSKVSDIILVPRDTVTKYLVSSNSDVTSSNVLKLAQEYGVQYLINGWIAKSSKGDYRFYANLMEVESQAIQEKIAIISFTDREDALKKLNKFIVDITSKLSRSPEELAQLSKYKMYDYTLYQMAMKAYVSQKNGDPHLAINLLEKAIAHIERRQKTIMSPEEIESLHYYSGAIRMDLAKLYTSIGKNEPARVYLSQVMEYKDSYPPMAQKLMTGLEAEHNKDFKLAEKIYTELIDHNPQDNFYRIRLADVVIKEGKDTWEAVKILEQGLDESKGNNSVIAQRLARLQMENRGEKEVFEKYAGKEWIKGKGIRFEDRKEVVVSILDNQIKRHVAENNPLLKPLKVKMVNGLLSLDASKIESVIDLSCEETTAALTTLADMAVVNGNIELAQKLAVALEKHGSANNSQCSFHEISANILLAQGKFEEAKKHALMINPDSPSRFMVLGEIYQQQGNYKKAAAVMEKALRSGKEVHPFLYYKISKAYELAGNFKKWNSYKNLFLKRSEELGLIPAEMQDTAKEIVFVSSSSSANTSTKVRIK